MEEQEYKQRSLELEERKFEFEREKYKNDSSITKKHFATIITAIISISAVTVSYLQFIRADLSRDKELTIQREQKNKELDLLKAQKDREVGIELAKFIAANKEAIYSKNDEERELIKDVILVAYQQFAVDIFKKLAETSSGIAKDNWEKAKNQAQDVKRRDILVTYYANAIPDDTFNNTIDLLKKQGFSVDESRLYRGAPPQWLEKNCSVIYYDDSNLSLAKELAEKLGSNFRIIKGTVFNEIRGQESVRIIVHHLQCSS